MASIFLFLLLLLLLHQSAFSLVTAQQRYSNISLGSELSPTTNSSWLSHSGRFAFGFYPTGNGFAVGIWFAGSPETTVVWTANRDDQPFPGNVTLLLTTDGRLISRPLQGQDKPIINAPESASSASMLDSGSFVLYNSDSKIIWSSFDSPTNTLLPGQRLLAGKELFSSVSETDHSTGKFRLKMQHDGHLVQYPVNTPDTAQYAYWASGTNGRGDNVTLNLDDDGHLYLLNSTSFNIKNLTDGGYRTDETIYRMTIDADGIFRLYSHSLNRTGNWSVIWPSSNDKCDPKGLCGLNGYCALMDQEAVCNCLPGFNFIDQGQRNLGCERNFISEDCRNKKESSKYTIFPLDNTIWEDDPYSTLSSTTKEDCEEACLGDCNCEAALFKDRQCRKQKLPLRYGRRNLGDSTIAVIKVGLGSQVNSNNTTPTRSKEPKKELRLDILIISVALVACAFVVLAISGVLIYRHRAWTYRRISDQGNAGLTEDVTLRSFTYGELEKATNGFKEEVGRGAFGTVFKGALSNGQRVIAVKRIEKVLAEGEREFQTEMKVIGRTHHRNLVRLLGYCQDGPNRLLVYEYMSNGSLADFLFRPERHPSWDERVGIALNIARGILYLHEECETQIIHCDIKPQNILMDENWCAKISDFGLAKLLKPDQTRTYTGIRGTRGYVAPEWHRNLPITVKADVFSFGIMFLEIICCRKSVDVEVPEDEAVLAEWVYDCFEAGELGGHREPSEQEQYLLKTSKESKKELRMDILIISAAFIACASIVLAISGVLIYNYHVRTYKRISDQGNVGLTEDVTLRSFTYGKLEEAPVVSRRRWVEELLGQFLKGPNQMARESLLSREQRKW
ncbi:hypothetical protein HHK36_004214 [Tetracentron sinense]|uniref:Receptor-like serine/threonine-protein kinase n=1 Tax=Tetracentron sinense TaxID=13715 RepID=A0A834ZQR6_TETSI|nr:hypothetical protein HHK36_004214 [Tetracentron sinense]